MGSDTFSLPILAALIERGPMLEVPVEVVAVVTQPDRPAGRGRRAAPNIVKDRATAADLRVLQPVRLREPDAMDTLAALAPDVIVVASFGQILPRVVLDLPSYNALNLHPSLLPRYRGPSPIIAPILAGDPITGTTLMLMAPKMDAGPILDQVETPIGPAETGGELRDRLAILSADLLARDLPRWLRGEIEPIPQFEGEATYTRLVDRADARLDWSLPAEDIARRVRAFNPRPGAFTEWNGEPLRIQTTTAAAGVAAPGHVVGESGGGIAVGTGHGVLVVETLQLPGGRPLRATEAVRGHPALLTAQFGRAD
jgi:methionyl-tRNA formyltransferase